MSRKRIPRSIATDKEEAPVTTPTVVARMNDDEWFDICRSLERHHALFYKLWEMGKPVFDEKIDTAQVEFNRDGALVAFVFNPTFYNKLSRYELEFVICHECLHVALNHGPRAKDSRTPRAANVALDVVVNHILVNNFGFDREQLPIANDCCWIDTVFADKKYDPDSKELVKTEDADSSAIDVPANRTFEFYYSLIFRELEKDPLFSALLKLVDGHGGLANGNSKDIDEIIDTLDKNLSPEDKQGLKDIIKNHYQDGGNDGKPGGQQAGKGSGGWTFVKVGYVKKQKKWETVIKKWSRKFWKPEYKDVEQWARLNRRFAAVTSDLLLPTEMEVESDSGEGQIEVWFFLDTSGSCYHLKERFFKAAKSLPPQRFKIRLFCFDDGVQETDLQSQKIYGGGGTSFSKIEAFIQKTIKDESILYPEAVFLITDGYGDRVVPQHPELWHWFLSSSYASYIPSQSKTYLLSDYE